MYTVQEVHALLPTRLHVFCLMKLLNCGHPFNFECYLNQSTTFVFPLWCNTSLNGTREDRARLKWIQSGFLPSVVPFPGHLPPAVLLLQCLVKSHSGMAHLRCHLRDTAHTLSSHRDHPLQTTIVNSLAKLFLNQEDVQQNVPTISQKTFPTPMASSMFTTNTILNMRSSSPSS